MTKSCDRYPLASFFLGKGKHTWIQDSGYKLEVLFLSHEEGIDWHL